MAGEEGREHIAMSAADRPVAVFDCMTFLQATTSPSGPSAACLKLVEDGLVRLVVTRAILDEVRDVLARPRIPARNPHLDDASVDAFLARVAELAPPQADVPTVFTYPRDPKDEPYLNVAISCGATHVVSFDNDLLDLMKPDNPDGQTLRSHAPDMTILTPPEFLRAVRGG